MAGQPTSPPEDINAILHLQSSSSHRRRYWLWLILAIALIAAVIVAMRISEYRQPATQYITAPVQQGELTVIVTATGTLEPVKQVEVGTETSGTVKTVNVDFNDTVTRGQVLASLDTEQIEARLRQYQAALATARASVTEAQATVVESQKKLERTLELQKRGLSSQDDNDSAQATFDRAVATLARAQAQVQQAQAQVDAEQTTLAKAVIRSPINGIVLKRETEPGQTVAASFQTPVLFLLAEDLTQMELKVAVDEADVGKVRTGQDAVFTVDAYPERTFPARISQVHYAPETVDGVVTYETVLSVDNSDLSLRPGMTATADIKVEKYASATLVPNAALRFTPAAATSTDDNDGGSLISRLLPQPPSSASRNSPESNGVGHQVWVLDSDQPRAVPVSTGASNGIVTLITGGELSVGMQVITDSQSRTP